MTLMSREEGRQSVIENLYGKDEEEEGYRRWERGKSK